MKKKKESDDILNQFYVNLRLLNPESFFFNESLTELMIQYLQNFIKSNEQCNFGFQIKNENFSRSVISNKGVEPLNSILIPMLSLSSLNGNEEKNEFAFDSRSKYNCYVKNFLKRNPVYSHFKKELSSQLYYQSSQRITFLAICHMIRPNILKKILFDRKREKINKYRWKTRNVFQAEIEGDDPASFINSMITDVNNNQSYVNDNNNIPNSILVDDLNKNENQNDNDKSSNEINISTLKDENKQLDSALYYNNDIQNDILIPKEEKQFASEVDFGVEGNFDNEIQKDESFMKLENVNLNEVLDNVEREKDDMQNQNSYIEKEIIKNHEPKEDDDNNSISKNDKKQSDIDSLPNGIEKSFQEFNKLNSAKSDPEITTIKNNSEPINIDSTENSKEKSFEIKNDKTNENTNIDIFGKADDTNQSNIKLPQSDREPKSETDKESDITENENNTSISKTDIKASDHDFLTDKKEDSTSILIGNSFIKRKEDSLMKADREEISESQTETELFEDSCDDVEFDIESSRSKVFDELSLSFFEMRTDIRNRLTRSTEPLFESWVLITCCVFFEFISSNSSFNSLRKNSSFSAKFEDFARSLVLGFVSSEKQSFHKGIISLLPSDSKFFYVNSIVTLDSIDKTTINQEKNPKKEEEEENEIESSTLLIDSKYLYYHHRMGIDIDSSQEIYSATNDSNFTNTASNDNESKQISLSSFIMTNDQNNDLNNNTQNVNLNENKNVDDFSVSKFMNPVLASYSNTENESIESFSMKIVLAKAVHAKAMKESQVLLDVSQPSPLISRALELRGVAPPHHPPDPSQYSPRKMRKMNMNLKANQNTVVKNDEQNYNHKTGNLNQKDLQSQKSPRKPHPKPRIKVSSANQSKPKTNDSLQSGSSASDSFYTFNRRMKILKNEKQIKKKNDEKRFQIRFDADQGDDKLTGQGHRKSLYEKKKVLKTSIKRAQLAESKGFIIREKAIEQHNRGVLSDYEVHKRSIYRDICSNEAKCAEELEKCASNGNLIIHSNIGRSVLFDKLEKNIRKKQVNQSFERLNGRTKGFGMEYDTDFSQLEDPIATAILEDGLF